MGSAPRIRSFPVLSVAGLLAAVLVGLSPVTAQTPPPPGTGTSSGTAGSPGIGVVAPQPTQPTQPSKRAPDFGFEPALPPEQGAPSEDAHGERTRTIYQPAFVKGAVKTTRTSRTSGIRVGLSGWTAPRIPFDDRDSSGFPAFGLTIEWGTPMEPPAEPTLPGKR
jgi:hypothetical protein